MVGWIWRNGTPQFFTLRFIKLGLSAPPRFFSLPISLKNVVDMTCENMIGWSYL